jgi:hypothetical protein
MPGIDRYALMRDWRTRVRRLFRWESRIGLCGTEDVRTASEAGFALPE